MSQESPSSESEPLPKNEELQAAPENADQASESAFRTEVITDPNSALLYRVHEEFMTPVFRPGELEPREVFQAELGKSDPNVRYVMAVALDAQDQPVSVLYGSVQRYGNDGAIAAPRFLLTHPNFEGKRAHQGPMQAFKQVVDEHCQKQGLKLTALVTEAVETSQARVNRAEIEPGNSMRRLYYPQTQDQMYYEIPPLAWNRDGTPAMDGLPENLQVAVAGYPDEIPVEMLEGILRAWWKEWYIRPEESFDAGPVVEGKTPWHRHQETVWNILEEKILRPLKERTAVVVPRSLVQTRSEIRERNQPAEVAAMKQQMVDLRSARAQNRKEVLERFSVA